MTEREFDETLRRMHADAVSREARFLSAVTTAMIGGPLGFLDPPPADPPPPEEEGEAAPRPEPRAAAGGRRLVAPFQVFHAIGMMMMHPREEWPDNRVPRGDATVPDAEEGERVYEPGDPEAIGVKMCVVCMSRRAVAAFVPCGHQTTCVTCSRELASRDTICPSCRKPFTQIIKVYS